MILLPLPFLLAEFFLFLWFAQNYGFFQVLLAYMAPSLLGFLILSFQSRTALAGLQQQMQNGRDPGKQVMNALARFASGVLLIIPFFTTRALGILLLLPGMRQMMLVLGKAWIAKKVAQGRFRVFTPGQGPAGGFYRGGPRPDFSGGFVRPDFVDAEFASDAREEREAQVIDVTPIEIEAPKKKL